MIVSNHIFNFGLCLRYFNKRTVKSSASGSRNPIFAKLHGTPTQALLMRRKAEARPGGEDARTRSGVVPGEKA